MILLFILFGIANASLRQSIEHSVRQTIENSVHSHAYLRDVNAMCEVVTHRLSINGIYIRSRTDCTHADITSTMATTLDELYNNFEKTDLNRLKTQFYIQQKKYTECQRLCHIEKLFDGPIEYWVHDHIPDVNFDKCWPKCDFNITIGSLQMNELAFQPCFDCLASADTVVNQYNKFRVEFIQYEALLSKEIALVWRFQMPEILANKSKSAIIKY